MNDCQKLINKFVLDLQILQIKMPCSLQEKEESKES